MILRRSRAFLALRWCYGVLMNAFEDILQRPADILAWYLEAGVDEAVDEQPLDRYALAEEAQARRAAQAQTLLKDAHGESAASTPSYSTPSSQAPSQAPSQGRAGLATVRPADIEVGEDALKKAVELAAAAKTVDELHEALKNFDGCPLKRSATNLVFGDGSPEARVVLVGEAPGGDEDRQGRPFVGVGGQLLDKMLASIGLERSAVFVTNTVFWRPPGNRTPHGGEIAVCLPFVERLIELIDPAVLITVGGPATHSLLTQKGSVSRLRGRWFTYETPKMSHPIDATAIYHPDHLLGTPAHKRQAWADLLAIKAKLVEHG